MKCPKCGEEMTVKRYGVTNIHYCPKCGCKVLEKRRLNVLRKTFMVLAFPVLAALFFVAWLCLVFAEKKSERK